MWESAGAPMRRWAALVLLVVPAVMAAGCGNPTLRPYGNVSATATCLRDAGYKVQTQFDDVVASTAGRGALRAKRHFNVLTIAFGDDAREALSLRRAYQRFIEKRRARHILDFTEIERNALLVWTTTPSDEQLSQVVDCLR
jgi:hypothetical protein